MKPIKKEGLKDYKAGIVEDKKGYLIESMSFRRRILEEKETEKLGEKKKKEKRL